MGDFLKSEKALLLRLGKRIAEFRKEAGLTQAELGHRCEMEMQNISRIERGGNNLTILSLNRICKELQIKLSDLIAGLDE